MEEVEELEIQIPFALVQVELQINLLVAQIQVEELQMKWQINTVVTLRCQMTEQPFDQKHC